MEHLDCSSGTKMNWPEMINLSHVVKYRPRIIPEDAEYHVLTEPPLLNANKTADKKPKLTMIHGDMELTSWPRYKCLLVES